MLAGELAALEEIVGMLISKQPQPLLKPIVVKALAWLCDRAHQQACSQVRHKTSKGRWPPSGKSCKAIFCISLKCVVLNSRANLV